jgi:DNA-binding transcriptional MocR family regulator
MMCEGTQAGGVDPDGVMVTAGNSQAISHAAMVFSKTNKRVFVEEPTYFLAHDIFRELGLQLSGLPVDEHGLNVREGLYMRKMKPRGTDAGWCDRSTHWKRG